MRFVALIFFCTLVGCDQTKNNQPVPKVSLNGEPAWLIRIQPFTGVDPSAVTSLEQQIGKHFDVRIVREPAQALPVNAFYKPRSRYIADTLLEFLSKKSTAKYELCLGVLGKDISTRKEKMANWGVMGLGYLPGNACVISTYRVFKACFSPARNHQRLLKVAVHELGHNFGLPHCAEQTCLMVDAEGGDKLDKESGFCNSCRSFLLKNQVLKAN